MTQDAHDGSDLAPQRPAAAAPSPQPAPAAGVPAAPRNAELSALLGQIGVLRTTLQSDLAVAAAALDAGADDLAAQVVRHDLHELAQFRRQAHRRLGALADRECSAGPAPWTSPDPGLAVGIVSPPSAAGSTGAPTPGDGPAVPAGAVPLPDAPLEPPQGTAAWSLLDVRTVHRRSGRRRRRLLPAAPVLAAAALLGLFVGIGPDRGTGEQGAVGLTAAAAASWQLESLASRGASTEELVAAAENLNEQIVRMVADAGGDPAAAQQALLLLQRSTLLLSQSPPSSALARVLAQARSLEASLREALPEQVQRRMPPALTVGPSASPSSLEPLRLPRRPPAPQQTSTGDRVSSPRPAPAARPSASPPGPTVSPTPSAQPSPSFGPLLPGFFPGD